LGLKVAGMIGPDSSVAVGDGDAVSAGAAALDALMSTGACAASGAGAGGGGGALWQPRNCTINISSKTGIHITGSILLDFFVTCCHLLYIGGSLFLLA
jgi:hypothetical protein